MRILFEGNLGSEAKILARVLRKAFSLRCKAEKKDLSSAFKSSRKLKGFVVRKTRKFRNCVLLTHRDIFVPKAKSREGDWIFGYAFGTTNQFFISVARLRSRDRRKYRKRLEFITIHELGHQLVKNRSISRNSSGRTQRQATQLTWACTARITNA